MILYGVSQYAIPLRSQIATLDKIGMRTLPEQLGITDCDTMKIAELDVTICDIQWLDNLEVTNCDLKIDRK
jgi:hypothetical protein